MVVLGTNYCKKKKKKGVHTTNQILISREKLAHIVTNSLERKNLAKKVKNFTWILFPSYNDDIVFVIVILTRIQNDTEQNSNIPTPNLFCKSWHLAPCNTEKFSQYLWTIFQLITKSLEARLPVRLPYLCSGRVIQADDQQLHVHVADRLSGLSRRRYRSLFIMILTISLWPSV